MTDIYLGRFDTGLNFVAVHCATGTSPQDVHASMQYLDRVASQATSGTRLPELSPTHWAVRPVDGLVSPTAMRKLAEGLGTVLVLEEPFPRDAAVRIAGRTAFYGV